MASPGQELRVKDERQEKVNFDYDATFPDMGNYP
jgi:hypothetical protein